MNVLKSLESDYNVALWLYDEPKEDEDQIMDQVIEQKKSVDLQNLSANYFESLWKKVDEYELETKQKISKEYYQKIAEDIKAIFLRPFCCLSLFIWLAGDKNITKEECIKQRQIVLYAYQLLDYDLCLYKYYPDDIESYHKETIKLAKNLNLVV
jgi:hypothetical protein